MENFKIRISLVPLALAFIFLLPLSCGKFETIFVNGKARRDTGRTGPGPDKPASDTSLMISAVRYDPGYNWVKDSLHGNVPFEIVLYDDFDPVLVIKALPGSPFSPSPDSHHIIDGSLYTECVGSWGTVVCRNGNEVVRLDTMEKLCGLLPAGEDLYILSRKSGSSGGFVFRKNAAVLLSRSLGSVFGDFGEPSYGQTGALYMDGGVPCFSYMEGNAVYVVRGGSETMFLSRDNMGGILDVKSVGGGVQAAFSMIAGVGVENARIWSENQEMVRVSCVVPAGDGYSAVARTNPVPVLKKITSLVGMVYSSAIANHVVCDSGTGETVLYSSDSGKYNIFRDSFLPGRSCVAFLEAAGRLAVAMASLDGSDVHPVWDSGDGRKQMELHGYPTCAAFDVSLPR